MLMLEEKEDELDRGEVVQEEEIAGEVPSSQHLKLQLTNWYISPTQKLSIWWERFWEARLSS